MEVHYASYISTQTVVTTDLIVQHAHSDLSNDLCPSFLDPSTLMYSSAINGAVRSLLLKLASSCVERLKAQWRTLDTLLDRALLEPGQTLLDIGFGWGGL